MKKCDAGVFRLPTRQLIKVISLTVDYTGCVGSSLDCHFRRKFTKIYGLDLTIG
jgi:hypothetical protein